MKNKIKIFCYLLWYYEKYLVTIYWFFSGGPKHIHPEMFRVFYNFWKQTEAEAQDINLPAEVLEHLDNSECVYRLSSSVKTSYGVGKIAMTQKRLFLLTTGRCRYVEITKFMDIEVCEFIPVILLLKWEVSVCCNRMNPVNPGSKDLHCFVPAFENPISKDQEQAKERCIWS